MKHFWNVIYFVWAGMAFCVIPLAWLLIYIIKRDVTIKDIYGDWTEHLDTGNAWGVLDRGRNGKQPMKR